MKFVFLRIPPRRRFIETTTRIFNAIHVDKRLGVRNMEGNLQLLINVKHKNNYGRIIKTQGNAFRILLVCFICVTLSHKLPVLPRLRKRVSNSSEWIANPAVL
jgi:hypothetical protein